jgi:hypothetical protein
MRHRIGGIEICRAAKNIGGKPLQGLNLTESTIWQGLRHLVAGPLRVGPTVKQFNSPTKTLGIQFKTHVR